MNLESLCRLVAPAQWSLVCAYLALMATSATWRMLNGASPWFLLRTRFAEVVAVRAVLQCGLWLTALVALAAVLTAAWLGWAAVERESMFIGRYALGWLGAAVVAALVAKFWHAIVLTGRPLDTLDRERNLREVRLAPGIAREALAGFGAERFPNRYGAHWQLGRTVRRCVVLCSVLLFAPGVASFFGAVLSHPLTHRILAELDLQLATARELDLPLVIGGGALAVTCFSALVLYDPHYLVVRLPGRLTAWIVCALVLVTAVAALGADALLTVRVVAGLAFAVLLRMLADLRLAISTDDHRATQERVRDTLREAFPGLAELTKRRELALPELTADRVAARLSKGCQLGEASDPLVRRHFVRFLRRPIVRHEAFAQASLRMMTVRRHVDEHGPLGTLRSLQNPAVPAWDEARFPLRVPEGYVNWRDPLVLHEGWDRVSICGGCGGSGQRTCGMCSGSGRQTRTETQTEHRHDGTHSVTRTYYETCSGCGGSGRVTCGTCSGHGRVVFQRILVTTWSTWVPGLPAPRIPTPELLSGAEENIVWRLPLAENRQSVRVAAASVAMAPELAAALDRGGEHVRLHLAQHAAAVCGGRSLLYRADVQLGLFHGLMVDFGGFSGMRGWFFGARPEFHFPRLPLSLGKLATAALLPAALISSVPWAVEVLGPWLAWLLPSAWS